MKLVVPGARNNAKCAPGLIRLLPRAFAIQDRLEQNPDLTLQRIAEVEGVSPSYVTRLLRLSAWADREHAHEEHPPAVQVGSPAKAARVRARLISGPSQAGRFCRWMQVVESCVNRFGRRKDGPLKRA